MEGDASEKGLISSSLSFELLSFELLSTNNSMLDWEKKLEVNGIRYLEIDE